MRVGDSDCSSMAQMDGQGGQPDSGGVLVGTEEWPTRTGHMDSVSESVTRTRLGPSAPDETGVARDTEARDSDPTQMGDTEARGGDSDPD